MTDHELSAYVEDLAERVPYVAPPMADVLAAGRAGVVRRRRRRGAGLLAGVVVVVASLTLGPGLLQHGEIEVLDNATPVTNARLTATEIKLAAAAARAQVTGTGATLTAVTVMRAPGLGERSNTGTPCNSGRLLLVNLYGDFPDVVVTGTPGGDGGPVTGVHLTLDAASGVSCQIRVQTSPTAPDPAAVFVDLAIVVGEPAPTDTQLVGADGVVIAVPASWSRRRLDCLPVPGTTSCWIRSDAARAVQSRLKCRDRRLTWRFFWTAIPRRRSGANQRRPSST